MRRQVLVNAALRTNGRDAHNVPERMVFPVAFRHHVFGIVWNHLVVTPFRDRSVRPGIATRGLVDGLVQRLC
jgi:hypothetical protein